MNVLLVVAAVAGGVAAAVATALLNREILGHIEVLIERSVDRTIASLPPVLHAEWAEEWRAEAVAKMKTPLTAALFARGLRYSAKQLIADAGLAAVVSDARSGTGGREPPLLRLASAWQRRGPVVRWRVWRIFAFEWLDAIIAASAGLAAGWLCVSSGVGLILAVAIAVLVAVAIAGAVASFGRGPTHDP